MKVIHDYPPNIDLIRAALKPNKEAIYCYGETIYNPSKRTITPDVERHEQVHSERQGDRPDLWYAKYLTDSDFRLQEEIIAYGEQYLFAKEHIKDKKLLSWLREKLAQSLSGEEYGSLLSFGEAEAKIRLYKAIK